MIIPNEEGLFSCECKEFTTNNVFNYIDHKNEGYEWNVVLSRNYRFDLYQFLSFLDEAISKGDLAEIADHVQSVALLLLNASGGDLQRFVEESIVRCEIGGVIHGLEEMLGEVPNE